MSRINVLIPTTDRPAMLRQALRSVRTQTAIEQIGFLLVSENAVGRDSEQVCKEFCDLPLTYVHRNSPVSLNEHAYALLQELPDREFTAILHDDDWWGPLHLEYGLRAFDRHPTSVAYYASWFEATGENALLSVNPWNYFWPAAQFGRLDQLWVLDAAGGALSCLPGTPGHYSALLARTTALNVCAPVFRLGNPYDADRLLTLALSRLGEIVCNPTPQIFVRRHPGQETGRFLSSDQLLYMAQTTERIIAQCAELKIDLRSVLATLFDRCPPEHLNTVLGFFAHSWCAPVLLRHDVCPPQLQRYVMSKEHARWKTIARSCIPPITLSALRRLLARR